MSVNTSEKMYAEIEERVKQRYLDRLAIRVKRVRKQLSERNWEDLRTECHQVSSSAKSFGFYHLSQLAANAEEAMPPDHIPRAAVMPEARRAVDRLIAAIDDILVENAIHRA